MTPKVLTHGFKLLLVVLLSGFALPMGLESSTSLAYVASTQGAGGELLIFSGRKEPLLAPVLALFQEQTGVRVTAKFGQATALAQEILQLQRFGRSVPDIIMSNDSGTLEFLRVQGALRPYTSPAIERIPERFRAQDGSWLGVSGRSRAIIYNKDLVSPDELPTTVFDLIAPKWKGRIAATNAGNESLVSWVSALRLVLGDELVRVFLEKLKENEIALISSSHTDIRKAVGRGEYAIGLINHYYYHLQRNEPDPALRNVGILYHDQGAFQMGTFLNAAGAGIVRGASNAENAQRFLDFLASPEAQKLFAEVNFEYPLLPGVEVQPEVLEAVQQATGCERPEVLECLKLLPVPLDALGNELESTQRLLEEVDWF
jgi:iron(III) transport system substrate-binding protein